MLSLACPKCGASCRIPLTDRPRQSCGACNHEGELPEAIAARVRAAYAVLSRTSERDRQFRGLRRTVASSALVTTAAYSALALLVALGSGALTSNCSKPRGLWGVRELPHPLILPGFAAVLSLAIATPTLFSLVRSGKKLRAIARALPPLRAGEPSACRVCGGPINGLGVIRCAFCASDNVVDAKVITHAGEEGASEAKDLEEEVRTQAAAIGEARGVGFPMVTALALFPVPFIATWFGERLAHRVDLPLTDAPVMALDEEHVPPHGRVFCLRNDSSCADGYRAANCVAHGRVAAGWAVDKTTVEGRRIVRVRDNAHRGLEVILDDDTVVSAHGVCVHGAESDEWKRRKERRAQ